MSIRKVKKRLKKYLVENIAFASFLFGRENVYTKNSIVYEILKDFKQFFKSMRTDCPNVWQFVKYMNIKFSRLRVDLMKAAPGTFFTVD